MSAKAGMAVITEADSEQYRLRITEQLVSQYYEGLRYFLTSFNEVMKGPDTSSLALMRL
jgi:hypothetical protein